MSELACDRFEMIEHVDAIAEYVAKYTTMTAKQAYIALLDYVNDLIDKNKPCDEMGGRGGDGRTNKVYRAEARERLKNSAGARFSAEALVIALAGGRIGQVDWSIECDRIISLLDDDDESSLGGDA